MDQAEVRKLVTARAEGAAGQAIVMQGSVSVRLRRTAVRFSERNDGAERG